MAGEKIQSYEELRIWQDAMRLVELVYAFCKQLPKDEVYGLTNQMKRAAVSIPSNIAEGSERSGTKELVQFLYIARGSQAELRTQIKLACRLRLARENEELNAVNLKLSRGLANLIKSLNKPILSPVTCHLSH